MGNFVILMLCLSMLACGSCKVNSDDSSNIVLKEVEAEREDSVVIPQVLTTTDDYEDDSSATIPNLEASSSTNGSSSSGSAASTGDADPSGDAAVAAAAGDEDASRALDNSTKAAAAARISPRKVTCLLPEMTPPLEGEGAPTAADKLTNDDQRYVDSLIIVGSVVKVVNGSALLQSLSEQYNASVTNRNQSAACLLTLFYASWCPFSAAAAPHFNALPRSFPQLDFAAVDSSKAHSLNTQFGVMALPTLILFHNARPIFKFNHSEYELPFFTDFVTRYTGIEAASTDFNLTASDQEGPLPSYIVPEPDYYLYLAWLFTLVTSVRYFFKSSVCQRMIETVRNAWREAEIQHEHRE